MKHFQLLIPALIIVPSVVNAQDSFLTDSLANSKVIHVKETDYVPARSFYNLPDVEEIIFDGLIGHIDGYQISNCPKLKRIVFNGPIFSTGGYEFASNCPNLTKIEINSLALNYNLFEFPECDNISDITINGAIVYTDSPDILTISVDKIVADTNLVAQANDLAVWQIKAMNEKGWIKKISTWNKDKIRQIIDQAGLIQLRDSIDSTYEAKRDPDEGKSKLQILKESAPYTSDSYMGDNLFTYADANDSLLKITREYFNLDSVAGNGNDISRIKNLLYWAHDLVRHDGSSGRPDCHYHTPELTKLCREQDRGLNCRLLAMILTEALLAEGIPARYITCESKAWDEDNECHVISVAWSESLNKWVWVDPTYAAYVCDENGIMLHPGEVRYRLQNDLPIVLNKDANWNHEWNATTDGYIREYMAKNLYVMSANSIQQSEPEGQSEHVQGHTIALVPEGFVYSNARTKISDDNLFWKKPY